jgi:hypothetical protein
MSGQRLWESEIPERLYPAYSYTAYLREVTDMGKLVVDVDLGFGMTMRGQSFELNGVTYTPALATDPKRRNLARRIRNALLSSSGRLLLLVHRRSVVEYGLQAGYAVDVFFSDSGAPGAGPIYLNALVANGDTIPVEE